MGAGHRARVALLIFALALAVRVVVIAADPGYAPQHDAFDYDRHAVSIAAGEGFPLSGYAPGGGESALRSPAYPAVLGATYAVFGVGADGGRLLGAFFGAVLSVLCFAIARRIWGHSTAVVAGVLTAVFPPLVLLSRELYSETMFAVVVLTLVLVLLEHRAHGGRKLRWAAAAGALCGLAALTRNPGIVLFLPAMIGAWVVRPRFSVESLLAPLAVLATAALVIAPWTIRNAAEFGRFIPVATATGFGLAGTYNETARNDPVHPASWRTPASVPEYEPLFKAPGVDEGTLDATLRKEALGHATSHPGYVAEVTARNLLRLFEIGSAPVVAGAEVVDERGIGSGATTAERISLAIVMPFALLGILLLVRRSAGTGSAGSNLRRGPLFMWLIPVLLIAVAVPVAGLPRYRIPADPFLLILAAIGLRAGWQLLRSRRTALLRGAALSAVSLGVLAGCGDGEPAPNGGPPAGEDAASAPASNPTTNKEFTSFVREADTICASYLRRSERLAERALGGLQGGTDSLEFTTEQLIAPGLELRRRLSRELSGLDPPQDAPPALERYLGLFAPIEELIVRRLAAGRRGDVERVGELELLLGDLAEQQLAAAREVGLEQCSIDTVRAALG